MATDAAETPSPPGRHVETDTGGIAVMGATGESATLSCGVHRVALAAGEGAVRPAPDRSALTARPAQ